MPSMVQPAYSPCSSPSISPCSSPSSHLMASSEGEDEDEDRQRRRPRRKRKKVRREKNGKMMKKKRNLSPTVPHEELNSLLQKCFDESNHHQGNNTMESGHQGNWVALYEHKDTIYENNRQDYPVDERYLDQVLRAGDDNLQDLHAFCDSIEVPEVRKIN